MNLQLLASGYSLRTKDIPIMSGFLEDDAIAKRYGVLPTKIDELLNDAEYMKALAVIRAEQAGRGKK